MAETDTRQFAAEQVDKLLGKLAFQISRTLKSRDPNSVHDLRVSIRRFSQALAVHEACFPAKSVKKIRRRLKAMMIPAGAARDCDIAIQLLSKSKLADADAWRSQFQNQRKQAERALLSVLARWMERKMSLKWRGKLQTSSAAGEQIVPDTVEKLAVETLPVMAKRLFDRGNEAAGASYSSTKLHQFRISVKKFRYTLELFVPVYSSHLGVWLDQIRSVQTLLGGINDCDMVRSMLSRSEAGKTLDAELRKKQRKLTEEFQRKWMEQFAGPEIAGHWVDYLGGLARKRLEQRKPMGRSISMAPSSREAVTA
jgi:CHAD domain-containing protein